MDQDALRERLLGDLFGDSRPPGWAHGRLLRSGEVAVIFQVSRRAVTEWARAGKLPFVTTLGGHRRFPADLSRPSTPP